MIAQMFYALPNAERVKVGISWFEPDRAAHLDGEHGTGLSGVTNAALFAIIGVLFDQNQ
jgi:hypothetical protein